MAFELQMSKGPRGRLRGWLWQCSRGAVPALDLEIDVKSSLDGEK